MKEATNDKWNDDNYKHCCRAGSTICDKISYNAKYLVEEATIC